MAGLTIRTSHRREMKASLALAKVLLYRGMKRICEDREGTFGDNGRQMACRPADDKSGPGRSCGHFSDKTAMGLCTLHSTVVPTPSFLNAVHFPTSRDNLMFSTMFKMLSSKVIPNIYNMLGYL